MRFFTAAFLASAPASVASLHAAPLEILEQRGKDAPFIVRAEDRHFTGRVGSGRSFYAEKGVARLAERLGIPALPLMTASVEVEDSDSGKILRVESLEPQAEARGAQARAHLRPLLPRDAHSLRNKWKLSPKAAAEYTAHFILRYVLAHAGTAASTYVLWDGQVYSLDDAGAFRGQKSPGAQPKAQAVFRQFKEEFVLSLYPEERAGYLAETGAFLERLEGLTEEDFRSFFQEYFARFGDHAAGAMARIADVRGSMALILGALGFSGEELASLRKAKAHSPPRFESHFTEIKTAGPPLLAVQAGRNGENSLAFAEEILKETRALLSSTIEGKFLLDWERRHSVSIYFFGGSVPRVLQAAIAHKTSRGPPPLSLAQVFSPVQDIDLAVDGSAAESKALKEALSANFPLSFTSGFSRWETRPLRHKTGKKDPIVTADGQIFPNLAKTHNDSLSLSLLSFHGDFFDLRRGLKKNASLDVQDSGSPNALTSLLKGELEYFPSTKHQETPLAAAGFNPPWVSVLRYLVKIEEYQLDVPQTSWPALMENARTFSPSALKTPLLRRKSADWVRRIAVSRRGLELLHALPSMSRERTFLQALRGSGLFLDPCANFLTERSLVP